MTEQGNSGRDEGAPAAYATPDEKRRRRHVYQAVVVLGMLTWAVSCLVAWSAFGIAAFLLTEGATVGVMAWWGGLMLAGSDDRL